MLRASSRSLRLASTALIASLPLAWTTPALAYPPKETAPSEAENTGEEQRSRAEEAAGSSTQEQSRPVPRSPVEREDRDLTSRIRELGESRQADDGDAPPPVQTAAPPSGQQPVECRVAEGDEFLRLLAEAAVASGLAPGQASNDPRDAQTDMEWRNALAAEQAVQDRLMGELARLQGEVARALNAYLSAAAAWQDRYSYVASSTTGLQGLMAEWTEAREVYEQADMAFAVANLGVGGVKIGFRAFRWLTARRAAAAADEATLAALAATERTAASNAALANTPASQVFAPIAASGDAGGAYRAAARADMAGALAEAQALELWTMQVQRMERSLNRAIAEGASPQVVDRLRTGLDTVRRMRPGAEEVAVAVAGGADDAAALARAQARWSDQVAQAERGLAEAQAAGDAVMAEAYQEALASLKTSGPPTMAPRLISQTDLAREAIDPAVHRAAAEYGVETRDVVDRLARTARNVEDIDAADMEILARVAAARGWHRISMAADDVIGRALVEARASLAGMEGASISPATVENLRRLKQAVEARKMNFVQYLRNAASEVGGRSENAVEFTEGIALLYTRSDIDLLLKVLDSGGDVRRLRQMVGPVEQASMNGLVRGSGTLDGPCLGAAEALTAGRSPRPAASGAAGAAGQQALVNVLEGTGQLGQVGLNAAVDQFGITDRFTAGQGYGRAVAGELWELLTSPSATTASYYYTWEAQNAYMALLRNEASRLVELGVHLDAASRALADLQRVLDQRTIGPASYLGSQGPADLRRALDDLQRTYDSGSPGWKAAHAREMEARRAHIEQKLADLEETLADLRALSQRMGQLRAWLDSVRLGPDGRPRGPVEAFNPLTFVRLGSISAYLKGMAADVFGLAQETPFRVAVLPQAPAPLQPAGGAPDRTFEDEVREAKARAEALDQAPEVEADPSLDAFLDGLEGQ